MGAHYITHAGVLTGWTPYGVGLAAGSPL